MTDEPIDERLIVLETKLSYHQKTIDDLNAVILEQDKRLSRLEQRLQVLEQAVEVDARDVGQEKPPHY
ncbi:MAG TPA: SlyX family protein [Polyangiaceae bacterium]|nr:SlyX family protein [Polyangiaceae bacterium]